MKCICCQKDVKKIEISGDTPIPEAMFDEGTGFKITCGYASMHDGEVFHAVICDNCIIQLCKQKVITFEEDYIFGTSKEEHEKFITDFKRSEKDIPPDIAKVINDNFEELI